jgi:hypothetical protein
MTCCTLLSISARAAVERLAALLVCSGLAVHAQPAIADGTATVAGNRPTAAMARAARWPNSRRETSTGGFVSPSCVIGSSRDNYDFVRVIAKSGIQHKEKEKQPVQRSLNTA